MKISQSGLLRLSFFVLLLLLLFSWFFTNTIYANKSIVYALFIVCFSLFLLNLVIPLYEKYPIDISSTIWFPFLFYSLLLYIFSALPIRIIFYSISIILLIIAYKKNISSHVIFSVFLLGGAYSIIGIFVQYLLPNFYYSTISPLFKNEEQINLWGVSYGFAGFTNQVDVSARMIIYAEAAFVYIYADKFRKAKWAYYAIIFLMIIAVFLTGKRLAPVVALLTPLLVYFFSLRGQNKIVIGVVSAILALFVTSLIVLPSIANMSDNLLLRRFAYTLQNINDNTAISSQRDILWSKAIEGFQSHPLFGIGVNQFQAYSGINTEAHNSYLQVLCEQGLFGLTLFVIPLVYCFVLSIKTLKHLAPDSTDYRLIQFSIFQQLFFMLNSITSNNTTEAITFIMYFLAIALLSEVRLRIRYTQV